jgi:hypothetical protein
MHYKEKAVQHVIHKGKAHVPQHKEKKQYKCHTKKKYLYSTRNALQRKSTTRATAQRKKQYNMCQLLASRAKKQYHQLAPHPKRKPVESEVERRNPK